MNLKCSGGNGFSFSNEVGSYEVRYNDEIKKFNSLSKAILFFEKLNAPKAIWDVSGIPELLAYYE